MRSISEHLHHRPYQVAISDSPDKLPRKWNHLGTFHEVSHLSAAYKAIDYEHVIDTSFLGSWAGGVIFKATNSLFIRVGFGS